MHNDCRVKCVDHPHTLKHTITSTRTQKTQRNTPADCAQWLQGEACCLHNLTIVITPTRTNTQEQTQEHKEHRETHLLIAHNDCKVKPLTLLLCEKRRRREGWRPHELVRTQGQIPGNQLFMKYELSNQRGSNNNLQFLWLLAIYSDIKLIRTDEDSGYLAINAIRDFYLSNADNGTN